MPQGKGPDIGILGVGVFQKRIDSHAGKVLVALAEVDQIEVNHFLFNQVFGGGGQYHFREEPRGVNSAGGIINDSLDYLLSHKSLAFIIQDAFKVLSQVIKFVLFVALEVNFLTSLFARFLFRSEFRFGDVHARISTNSGLGSDCVDRVFNLIRLL